MTSPKDLAKSSKASYSLMRVLERLPDDAPAGDISLTVIFKATAGKKIEAEKNRLLAENGQPVDGIEIRSNIGGGIFTANISLNGLEKLLNDKRVHSVSSSDRLKGPK